MGVIKGRAVPITLNRDADINIKNNSKTFLNDSVTDLI